MKREVYTFSPGPCIFPLEVLQETQKQILDAKDTYLEYSLGSPKTKELIAECKSLFAALLRVPDNYTIILGSGGATAQFAAIPFNLLDSSNLTAHYIVNGTWSELAYKECQGFAKPILANSFQKKDAWLYAPILSHDHLTRDSKFLYFCDNETVHGIEFSDPPRNYGVDMAVDMTSNFLTRPVDCSKYGLVYSGAQKNWGPAGLNVVIIRNDLLAGPGLPNKPSVLDFKRMLRDNEEGTNVPLFSLLVAVNTLKWILRNGGLETMDQLSKEKARMIYDLIDSSNGFYVNRIHKNSRSRVNIVCQLRGNDPKLTQLFVKEAAKKGLLQLGGHKSVGGLRFSIYNGMPLDGVRRLRDFMVEFQKQNENKPKL